MVSITAKSIYFKQLLFPFFKIFYTLIIVHYVINLCFLLESNHRPVGHPWYQRHQLPPADDQEQPSDGARGQHTHPQNIPHKKRT